MVNSVDPQNGESYIQSCPRESSSVYFPRESANQIHCYMTGPNPNLTLAQIPGMQWQRYLLFPPYPRTL